MWSILIWLFALMNGLSMIKVYRSIHWLWLHQEETLVINAGMCSDNLNLNSLTSLELCMWPKSFLSMNILCIRIVSMFTVWFCHYLSVSLRRGPAAVSRESTRLVPQLWRGQPFIRLGGGTSSWGMRVKNAPLFSLFLTPIPAFLCFVCNIQKLGWAREQSSPSTFLKYMTCVGFNNLIFKFCSFLGTYSGMIKLDASIKVS